MFGRTLYLGLGISLFVFVLLILLLLAIVIFEVWMFVSVINNKYISDLTKILWMVGMLVLHPFIAVAYYVTDNKHTANSP
jgi:hypothetical protein